MLKFISARLTRRDDEGVGGREQVVALIRKPRRSGEDEAEYHFAPMRGKVDIAASDADLGDSFGCRRDPGLCRLAAAERRPRRVRGNMAQEPLPAEITNFMKFSKRLDKVIQKELRVPRSDDAKAKAKDRRKKKR